MVERMQISDKIAISGVIVSFLGVCVTGYLTYWIMKFTKESANATKESANAARESAEAAKMSNDLNKFMIESQQEKERKLKEALRKEYKDKIYRASEKAQRALLMAYSVEINGHKNNIQEMHTAPRTHGLTDEQLAQFFNDGEKEQIKIAWDTFNDFIINYFRDPYNGEEEALAIRYAANPIAEFHHLMQILK